jgi:hypothetical protein
MNSLLIMAIIGSRNEKIRRGLCPCPRIGNKPTKLLNEFNRLCAERQNATDFCRDLRHLVKEQYVTERRPKTFT